MKIGWCSVSPFASTGYGRITREICSRLLEKHEVTCIGHEADVVVWGGKKELTLPNGRKLVSLVFTNPLIDEKSPIEILNIYIEKYGFNLLIGHWDSFGLKFLSKQPLPYLVYIPIDGYCTRKWYDYVKDAYRIILYSRFGYSEMLRYAPPSQLSYIPHGVDTNTFKPLNIDKKLLRRKISATPPIPEDCFLIVTVGANIGPRKNLPLLMRTFKKFTEKHPDTHLYIHTNSHMRFGRGYDLILYASMLNIENRIHWPTYNPILEAIPDTDLCKIYNAADIYVSNSSSEGFGLPIIEAEACGTPCIVPRNSSQTELVEGHGWIINNIPLDDYVEIPVYVPYMTEYPVPSQRSLLEKLEEAYSNPELRAKYGEESRKHALQYDWSNIMNKWFKLLDEVEEEMEIFKSILA